MHRVRPATRAFLGHTERLQLSEIKERVHIKATALVFSKIDEAHVPHATGTVDLILSLGLSFANAFCWRISNMFTHRFHLRVDDTEIS